MNVWSIIEAIDDPSGLIHPEKHQAFSQRTHPLAKHPAYPEHEEGGPNYEERLASEQWRKILQKANQYLGVPLTRQSLMVIHQRLLQAMAIINEAESGHREELESLAVELVFELPEFKSAQKAYQSGRLLIDAHLVDEIDTSGMATSEPLPEARTPAEEEWFKKMVQRRHFTNALIQGSAVSNDYLFEMAGPSLNRIHPRLKESYGILMVSTEIGYWMFPQDQIIAAARAKTHVGAVRVDFREIQEARRRPTVIAQALCFPVLIQEIIKGLTELASLPSLPKDAAERKEIIDQADLVDLEAWSMILGPKLWDSFIQAVDAENERELAMHLYGYIQRMDVDKFNVFMKEVLAKTPRGMQMLRDLAAKVKADLAAEDLNEASRIIQHVLENDEVDWKDIAGLPTESIRDALESLNSQYGRGSIVAVDYDSNRAVIKKQYGTEVAPFRVDGNTVFFRGHRVTVRSA
jgi:hypothetical protein